MTSEEKIKALEAELSTIRATLANTSTAKAESWEAKRIARYTRCKRVARIEDPEQCAAALVALDASDRGQAIEHMSEAHAVAVIGSITDDETRESILRVVPASRFSVVDEVRLRGYAVPEYVTIRYQGDGAPKIYTCFDRDVLARLRSYGFASLGDTLGVPHGPSFTVDRDGWELFCSVAPDEQTKRGNATIFTPQRELYTVSVLSPEDSKRALIREWDHTPTHKRRALQPDTR